jgi:S-adenosylmethionine:tRNA ribosyltransferase-isomerase
MKLSDFFFDLPPERIAQNPLPQRDASRLMVLHRREAAIEHQTFSSIREYLQAGDLLILNDTRVIPSRLFGRKQTGGKLEVFFLSAVQETIWKVLIRGKIGRGESFSIAGESLTGTVLEKKTGGRCTVAFSSPEPIEQILETHGNVPLPPYIRHFQSPTTEDKLRYQTVFARHKGAVAAPTAGLHFTEPLLKEIRARGIEIAFVTLHVGFGTFQSVKAEVIQEHTMEPEFYRLSPETLAMIDKVKKQGGRIIACGTTTTRVLESFGQNPDLPAQGWTNLFIYPGFPFKIVDGLITNFHLPGSTLLMLVSAFAGREFILSAYRRAIEQGYRFYSYGDAMLIL